MTSLFPIFTFSLLVLASSLGYGKSCTYAEYVGANQAILCLEPVAATDCQTINGDSKDTACLTNTFIGRCIYDGSQQFIYTGEEKDAREYCLMQGAEFEKGPDKVTLRPPLTAALASLESDQACTVTTTNLSLSFVPPLKKEVGVLIHPGAFVDGRAYGPLARSLCESGLRVEILIYEDGLATSTPLLGEALLKASKSRWFVLGHSLGGRAATALAFSEQSRVDGIILLASYAPEEYSLKNLKLSLLSIYADQDGLIPPGELLAKSKNKPKNHKFVAIKGGNHANFGSYGKQDGDKDALITRERQQQLVKSEILKFVYEN